MVREPANHIREKSWKHWGCLAKQRQHWRQSQEKQGRNFSLTNVHQGPFHPGDLTKTSKSKTKWNKSCNKTHPLKLVPMPLFFCFSNQEIPGSLTFSLVLTVHLQRMYQCRTFRTRFRSTGIPNERVLDRRALWDRSAYVEQCQLLPVNQLRHDGARQRLPSH